VLSISVLLAGADKIAPKMALDFFDPTPDQQDVILVDAATLRMTETVSDSCEYCNPAVLPFRE
jgi:hypothetical protein